MANTINSTTDKALLRSLIDGSFTGVFEDDSLTSFHNTDNKMGNMPNLTKVILPNIQELKSYDLFSGSTALETIFCQNVTYVNQYLYRSVPTPPKLVWVLPSLETANTETFRQGNFRALDIGEDFATSFHFRLICAYQATAAPTAIILRMKQKATLTGTETGSNVHLSGTVIYVPSDLVSSYEADTTWASMKTSHGFTFAAIEGSEYEHYYADGTPIPTT